MSGGGDDAVSRYEWIAALLGVVVFLGLTGYFAYEAMRGDRSGPDIVVRVDSVRRSGAGYVAYIRATNRGGMAASSVRIVGELLTGDSVVEASPITLDLLGPRSSQSGGLSFSRDPRAHSLRVRPAGFLLP
jgi:uncharacterized protein (TIGR02588 family)